MTNKSKKITKARSGQNVPTLTKAQEKRFDERFKYKNYDVLVDVGGKEIKQHLADELARQKKEIIEKLEKMKRNDDPSIYYKDGYSPKGSKFHNRILDQAIKTIKKI